MICLDSKGQDPNFSQFFSSPLNINPALTGNINADWRMISNIRDQWIGPASPYISGTISYDRKIFQQKSQGEPETRSIGIGGMLMYDQAMAGVQKSTYASLNFTYSKVLSEGPTKHSIGVGFGVTNGRRVIDYKRLDFQDQFTGYGFNTNLPTGEAALSNMKPYYSVSSGMTYSIKGEKSNLDFGVAGYHLNKPRQTFLEDENEIVPIRKVVHANYEKFLSDRTVLNVNAVGQLQGQARYYSFGAALGHYIDDQEDLILNGGLWYWSNNAIVPYFGLMVKNVQFGLSYDATVSKLRKTRSMAKTIELSIIIRGQKKSSGNIPCPWK